MKSIPAFLLCVPLSLAAQVDSSTFSVNKIKRIERRAEQHRYLALSFGSNSYWNRDYATSPIGYSGTIPNGEIAYRSTGERKIEEIVVGFSGGNIYGETDFARYQSLALSGYVAYNWLTPIAFKPPKWDLNIGVNNFFTFNNRINSNYFNAAYNFDYLNSTSLAARVQTRIKYAKGQKTLFRKRKGRNTDLWVDWNMQLNLPLLFLYTRPYYSVVEDFTDGKDDDATSDIQVGWYPDVWRYTFKTEVVWHLKNGNGIQMKYLYDMYQIDNPSNTVQSAQHMFNLGILFKLDKKGIYTTQKSSQ